MNKKDIKEFLPLGFLLVIAIGSLITVFLTSYTIGIKQYIGIGLLSISTILYFTNRKYYKYLLGIILMIASVIPISFSFWTIGITIIIFQLYVIPLIGLFIYLLVFRKPIIHIVFHSVQRDPEEEKLNYYNKVKRFKKKFSELNDTEINKKMNQDLVPEAKQALIEIKQDRN